MLQELGPKQRDRYNVLFSVPAPTFLCHIYLPFKHINKMASSPLLHIFQGNLFPLAHSQSQFGLTSVKNIFPLSLVFCHDGEGNKFCNKQYQPSIKHKCKINTIKDSFKRVCLQRNCQVPRSEHGQLLPWHDPCLCMEMAWPTRLWHTLHWYMGSVAQSLTLSGTVSWLIADTPSPQCPREYQHVKRLYAGNCTNSSMGSTPLAVGSALIVTSYKQIQHSQVINDSC